MDGVRPDTRNYGLDLLKSIAMLMVVTLHVLGHGGVLKGTVTTADYTLAWALESLAYPAVNAYVIVTGYLYAERSFRVKNLVSLWLQVLFFSVLVPAALKLAGFAVDSGEIVRGFFPVLIRRYWFFNAYFALFCLIPALNAVAQNRARLRSVLLVSLLLFSVMPVFAPDVDLFWTNQGSSVLWFAVLYLSGAYLKRCGLPAGLQRHGLGVYVLGCAFLLLSRLCFAFFVSRFTDRHLSDLFYAYTSPPVYLAAMGLVAGMLRVRISSEAGRRLAVLSSSLAFDVYLIHDHPVFRACVMADRFCSLPAQGPVRMALSVLAVVLGIFIVCEVIGLVRRGLFQALRIGTLSEKTGQRIEAVWCRWTEPST